MPKREIYAQISQKFHAKLFAKFPQKRLAKFSDMGIIAPVLNETVYLRRLTPNTGMNKELVMASKTKQPETTTPASELVLTADRAKRTRNVIKWQDKHMGLTCAAFSIFTENKDKDVKQLAMVGRKLQFVFESVAQTVKDGKAGKELMERRDNLELALAVAQITNSNVIEALDAFIDLFK